MSDDPEVIADLRLRSYTERDSSRGNNKALYDWTQPKIIGAWKCRVPGCSNHVGVTQDAMDALAMWNRELKRRNEKPLTTGEVMYCDSCSRHMRDTAPDRRRKQVDAVADVIKQLKAGDTQIRIQTKDGHRIDDERGALLQLEKWGHPDVKGFEQALAERRAQGKGKRERI